MRELAQAELGPLIYLEKEIPEMLTDGNKDLETRRILNFEKARNVPIIAMAHQLMKKETM